MANNSANDKGEFGQMRFLPNDTSDKWEFRQMRYPPN